VVTTSDGFVERMRLLVGCRDAPVYTISYYAHALLMSRIASDGFRVAVSGTGADEIFSGYYDHHLAYLAHVSQGGSAAGEARTAWERNVRPFVRNPHLSDPDLFVARPEFRDHLYLGADRYAALLTHQWREPFTEEVYSSDLLRNRMLNELLHETVPVILHEDDSNAMCWSVENRSPFLDRSLVEFCNRVPTRHLVRNGLAKALLRDAVRGIAPDVVLDNPRKTGFNAPITSFLDTSDPAVRAWLLQDSPIYDHVERAAIEALLNRATLPNSDSKFLFSFVSSKLFLDEYAL
jgi:asparagine synthase (glutamine-hydrolysing)